jgi:D-glucuronyl C5-epimerase-like protein
VALRTRRRVLGAREPERNFAGPNTLKLQMSQQMRGFLLAAALLGTLVAAAPSQASRVLVIDGDQAVKRDDPYLPARPAGELPPIHVRARVAVVHAARARKGPRAVARALRRARRARRISRSSYVRYTRIYRRARSVRGRLRGARRRQLSYVIGTMESLALSGRLISSRMPVLFLQLDRNRQFWPSHPFPAGRDHVEFRGSSLVWEYYGGEGLQIQPLVNFIKANRMYGACVGAVAAPCRAAELRRYLDQLSSLAARRSPHFIAWEYYFHFGGGSPPWMSGMAQATGIEALSRSSQLLGEPRYLNTARKALGAFERRPPAGVRTRGFRGGVHYLQYSFAPRVYIFNAFTQSLIGLYDYLKVTGSPRVERLFQRAEPELRREIPASNVGDWSRYSYRGPESDQSYHELLREVLKSFCDRVHTQLYCDYARKYRQYQTDPAVLRLHGPGTATRHRRTRVRFGVSKLSVVELKITKDGKTALDKLATFRRGQHWFSWRPRGTGAYSARLSAKELRTGRSLRTADSGQVQVGSP